MLSISLWSKIIFLLFVFVSITCGTEEADLTASYCDGTDWVPYLDEKCFKLIKRWATRDDAKNVCAQELFPTDPSIPQLVSIRSPEEQNFLTKYVFDESAVKISIWLGAKRLPNSNTFVWDDASEIGFSNWAEGSPTVNPETNCVEMQSESSKQFANLNEKTNLPNRIKGKWRDVTCELPNYVICEKLQRWSFGKMQQSFIFTRKELKDSLNLVTKELDDTRNQLSDTKNQLTNVQNNPVPIGFIYVQLSSQPEPKSLWPKLEWQDVTSEYAGLFFRAEGGNSTIFGNVQEESSPRLTQIKSHLEYQFIDTVSNIQPGAWSDNLFAGGRRGDAFPYAGLSFFVSEAEVRPRNKAVRIWKRIN